MINFMCILSQQKTVQTYKLDKWVTPQTEASHLPTALCDRS